MKIKKVKKILNKFCNNEQMRSNEVIKFIFNEHIRKIDKQIFRIKKFQQLEKEEEQYYQDLSEKLKEEKKIEELLWIVESKNVISNEIYYQNGFLDAVQMILFCIK